MLRYLLAGLLAFGFVSHVEAMGKTPPSDNAGLTPATPPANAPPANPYYNPPSNTGTSAPQNQGSMPINKGTRGPTDAPLTEPASQATGNSAATGVAPYGGAPAGPSGGK